ncbi:cation diffusion facilitator family transporter [Dethiobacter alkaliphilus]|uniref:cation diffusion facilitator family transporter n=1 Tax=Dethiobacter alkaliphilus TaxID=427926 RepID=UPI00222801A8|nr:cation diffusion facilitator family transporter [Dethiobacter alkaliphilus]MCW3490788.1 cation diffusion facilitator family transporter [Dethiobacter alkaliphilus]
MSTSLAQRVVFRTMLGNVLLVFMKLSVGIMAGSAALIAEAVHSAGDVIASFAVFISFRLSGKAPDQCHHFGHKKIESICTCLVGVLLILISYELITDAIGNLREGDLAVPGVAALYVTIACIVIKEGMYRYTINAANKVKSRLLYADAWHHRADMMVLSAVLVGVGGARLGYPILDGLVALGISVLILRLGIGFCRSGLGDLIDKAPDENTTKEIRKTVEVIHGVEDIHTLRARCHGSEVQMEIHIGVDSNMRVSEGHDVAKEVKTTIMREFPEVSHVVVHVDPVSEKLSPSTN